MPTKLGLLAGDREHDPGHGAVLPASAQPDKLADTPYGKAHPPNQAKLDRGKIVFAENCARCHSSKQPPNLCMLGTPCKDGQIIENTAAYFDWMRTEVQKPDFLTDNYPVDRPARLDPGNRHQCLSAAGHQRDPRQHLGQLLVRHLQGAAGDRQITLYNPVDGTPWHYTCRAAAAAMCGRPR